MNVSEVLERMAGRRVTVVGDVMVDAWCSAPRGRIADEVGGIEVFSTRDVRYAAGGAANVALCLARLGCTVRLVGFGCDDEHGNWLARELIEAGVDWSRVTTCRTSTKYRLLWDDGQGPRGIRFDVEDNTNLVDLDHSFTLDFIGSDGDCIVVCDYGKGVVYDGLIRDLTDRGAHGILVDTRGGELGKYRGASLLKPNARQLHCGTQPLEDVAAGLSKEYDAIFVATEGENGMVVGCPDGAHWRQLAVRVYPAIDAIGAGDMVLAGLAAAYDIELRQCCRFAAMMGALSVMHQGAHAVSAEDMGRFAHFDLASDEALFVTGDPS